MELLVSIKDKNLLAKISNKGIDGIIFGGIFSNKYNFSLDEMREINEYCLAFKLKRYISIDSFISEDDLTTLYEYIRFIEGINPDGIYFQDLGIINCFKNFDLKNKLIYDPGTLLTNKRDINFYLSRNIDVVIARELTLEEIIEIIKDYPFRLDMQIFGYLRMSYSKRKILSNYFNEIGKEFKANDNSKLTLIEETRNYSLPIKETKYGTCIYTDYVFLMYQEYAYLSKVLKRGIIDTDFIDDDAVIDLIRDARRITTENAEFLESSFIRRNSNYLFNSGYLYQKTTDKKEENGKD